MKYLKRQVLIGKDKKIKVSAKPRLYFLRFLTKFEQFKFSTMNALVKSAEVR